MEERDETGGPRADRETGGRRADRYGRRRRARASGNVARDPEPLRPRGVGAILDAGLEVLRARFGVLVGVCVLLWLPVRLLQPFFGMHRWFDPSSGDVEFGPLMFGIFLATIPPMIVQALGTALVAQLVYAEVEGRHVSAGDAMRTAFRRVLSVIGVTIVITIAVGFGLCLCALPGIYLGWRLSLALSIVVLEGASVSTAVQRSFALTPGSFWRYAGVVLLMLSLATPFNSLTAFSDDPTLRPSLVAILPFPEGVFDAITVVLSSVFLGIGSALAAAVTTIYYLDCRVRREGEDLRLRLGALDRAPGAAPEPAP